MSTPLERDFNRFEHPLQLEEADHCVRPRADLRRKLKQTFGDCQDLGNPLNNEPRGHAVNLGNGNGAALIRVGASHA